MIEKKKADCENKDRGVTEMMLGKRHDYTKTEERNFKSLAISLGFSAAELKTLDRIYVGPAEPDTDDGAKEDW